MTDTDFVLAVLREGPASTNEILRRSFSERGVGCMVHSRVADARRKLGAEWTIRCDRAGQTRAGRPEYVYEIVSAIPEGQLTLV
jgi:hypothetical protein